MAVYQFTFAVLLHETRKCAQRIAYSQGLVRALASSFRSTVEELLRGRSCLPNEGSAVGRHCGSGVTHTCECYMEFTNVHVTL
jgi:hypothetical protein